MARKAKAVRGNKTPDKAPGSKKAKLAVSSASPATATRTPAASQVDKGSDLFALAREHWALSADASTDRALVTSIYNNHLRISEGSSIEAARLAAEQLESTGYLERCLLPVALSELSDDGEDEDADNDAADEWLPVWAQSVFALVACRVEQGLGVGAPSDWAGRELLVGQLMRYAARLLDSTAAITTDNNNDNNNDDLCRCEQALQFLTAAFTCVDVPVVAKASLPFAWLSVWTALESACLQRELSARPSVAAHWASSPPSSTSPEATLVPNVAYIALRCSSTGGDTAGVGISAALQVEHARVATIAVGVLAILVGQPSTRRFSLAVLQNAYVVERLALSPLCAGKGSGAEASAIFKRKVAALEEAVRFCGGVDAETGDLVALEETESQRYDRANRLEVACFQVAESATREFAFLPVGKACDSSVIRQHLGCLSYDELWSVARQLDLVVPHDAVAEVLARDAQASAALNQKLIRETFALIADSSSSSGNGTDLLLAILVSYVNAILVGAGCLDALPEKAGDAGAGAAVWPVESEIMDETEEPVAAAKYAPAVSPLKTYSSLRDLAVRSWRASASSARVTVREQVDLAVSKLKFASAGSNARGQGQGHGGGGRGSPRVVGWAEENSSPISAIKVTKIGPVHFGQSVPAFVHAELAVGVTRKTAAEWRSAVRPNDLFVLVSASASSSSSSSSSSGYNVTLLRCCQVLHSINSGGGGGGGGSSALTLKWAVALDPHQYQRDMDQLAAQSAAAAAKATARTKHDKDGNAKKKKLNNNDNDNTTKQLAAGPGDAKGGASYDRVLGRLQLAVHCAGLRGARGFELVNRLRTLVTASDALERQMPDWLRDRVLGYASDEEEETSNSVVVVPAGLSCADLVKHCMRPGLSVVRGCAGSERVEAMAELLRALHVTSDDVQSSGGGRVLVVAQSEAVLDAVLERIVHKEFAGASVLLDSGGESDNDASSTSSSSAGRMLEVVKLTCRQSKSGGGSWCHGGRAVVAGQDMSARGRVDAVLAARLQDLASVQALASSLRVPGDVGSSCATAMRFFGEHVRPRIHAFEDKAMARDVGQLMQRVELAQAFELLLLPQQRQEFIVAQRAKVVAVPLADALLMTRKQLQQNGGRTNSSDGGCFLSGFDTLVVLDAGHMDDAQSLAALTLGFDAQAIDDDAAAATAKPLFRRVVLAGEPLCESPCCGPSTRASSPLSMLERLLRVGTPAVSLAPPSATAPGTVLASLLSATSSQQQQQVPADSAEGAGAAGAAGARSRVALVGACAGLSQACQFVDVQDFGGVGETAVGPHDFCNRGEAEFIVGTYMYLRLIGYPRESIVIATPYAAQRALILDTMRVRFQQASKAKQVLTIPEVVTLDDAQQLTAQGKTHQVVLVSLVRSSVVGRVRDPRSMIATIVGATRACILFGRYSVFGTCPTFSPTLSALLLPAATSSKASSTGEATTSAPLQLVFGEGYTKELQGPRKAKPAVHAVASPEEMGVLVTQMVAMV